MRNKMRIVCNPIAKHISYYLKNEHDEWLILTGSSILSRNTYTCTTMKEKASEIAYKLDEIYNRNNKGLDIIFEGDEENYKLFVKALDNNLAERDITCKIGNTTVIVVGKSGAGKTTLISNIEAIQGKNSSIQEFDDYILYEDENNTKWYEIKGIDFGEANVEKAYNDICKLVENTAGIIVYCINASARRIESFEKEFIFKLLETFPELTGAIVLTQCINKKGLSDFIDEIEKMADQIKVIPTLAEAFETDIENEITKELIVLTPFGISEIAEYIFEGR